MNGYEKKDIGMQVKSDFPLLHKAQCSLCGNEFFPCVVFTETVRVCRDCVERAAVAFHEVYGGACSSCGATAQDVDVNGESADFIVPLCCYHNICRLCATYACPLCLKEEKTA